MAVIALTSAKGAPGVTTTAVALTLAWPRPVLLVEADVAGSSSVLAGFYGGKVRHDRGLVDLAAAHRQGRLAAGLRESSIEMGDRGHARFLPGLTSPAAAGTMTQLWEPIAAVLRAMEGNGMDVIVDAGRLGAVGAPMPLLREADVTVLVSRTDLPAIAAARARAALLRQELVDRGTGEDALWMLLVGERQPFGKRDAKARVNLPVLGIIDWDPGAAEVISQGKVPFNAKKWLGSGFVRSASTVASSIDAVVRGRRERLAPGTPGDVQIGGGR